jgi:hypothetical protein
MRDTDPANRQSLDGLNVTARFGEKTVATGEIARSTTDLQGNGSGHRAEIRHEDQALQARAWAAETSTGFYNPNSVQSAGQSEYGAKIGYAVDEKNRIVGEALRTTNSVSGAAQTGAELKLEHSMAGNIKVEVGVRYSSSNTAAALSGPALPGSTVPITPTAAMVAAGTRRSRHHHRARQGDGARARRAAGRRLRPGRVRHRRQRRPRSRRGRQLCHQCHDARTRATTSSTASRASTRSTPRPRSTPPSPASTPS